jgi:hypothetical protein
MERWSVSVEDLSWDGVQENWSYNLNCTPTAESAMRQAFAANGWTIDSFSVYDRGFGGSKMETEYCIRLECRGESFDMAAFLDVLAKLGIKHSGYVRLL